MKQILFTLLLFCTVGLISCRKNRNEINIKQYDDQQIKAYISSAGLTGMQRDLSGGDTTGIYYKILTQGTGVAISYPTVISLVYSERSFDGSYLKTDTIMNHVVNYVGHVSQNVLPEGVELALVNILKNKGTRARVLVPSHLAFGIYGYGTGSSSGTDRLGGNQSLDYYLNVINDSTYVDPISQLKVNGQDIYDDISIKNYIAANNLSGYTEITTGDYKGLWYKITQAGTGAAITLTSVVNIQYTGFQLNGFQTGDQVNGDADITAPIDMSSEPLKGFVGGLLQVTPGAKLSLIIPSRLAYGSASISGIPSYSCLRYEMNVISVQ